MACTNNGKGMEIIFEDLAGIFKHSSDALGTDEDDFYRWWEVNGGQSFGNRAVCELRE